MRGSQKFMKYVYYEETMHGFQNFSTKIITFDSIPHKPFEVCLYNTNHTYSIKLFDLVEIKFASHIYK